MRAWADVAVLVKTKNLQGGFVVRSATGLPFLLTEGMEVAFVPPVHDVPRRGRVAAALEQGNGVHVVYFDTVGDIDVASQLAGCHCLVRREDLPADALAQGDETMIGWAVYGEELGFLGLLSDVVENPGQSLLSIQREGESRPLLVPAVSEFVVGIDEDARRIDVVLPAGLLDL